MIVKADNRASAGSDVNVLRELTMQYVEICSLAVQDERRDLWRRKNSLEDVRPLIYVRAFARAEMPQCQCVCRDPFYRAHENVLRENIFRATFNDDYIFEPWLSVRAVHKCTDWGVETRRMSTGEARGSWKGIYPLKSLDDISMLKRPRHEIDEDATARNAQRLADAVGDLITINVDRGPIWQRWHADLSTHLGYLRGIENFMLDMMDNPAGLHRLMAFMRDGVLAVQDQAEAAGDYGLCDHDNQAMTYSRELADPAANTTGVKRRELWSFMAAQEFALVSPQMHEEFLLDYQLPMLSKFGLAAYGCCEDLTRKIDMLRRIPNLRRIAVSPFADVRRCAEQIGRDYVISYRPSPADMVGYGFDRDFVKRTIRRDLEACKGCHVDITLKDVETVQGDPQRVRNWVAAVREVIDELY